MTFPAWAGEWGTTTQHALSRRQARRWSRQCSAVGVTISAARLRDVAAGTAATDAERSDLTFAVAALEFEREQHRAAMRRARFSIVEVLIFLAVTLIALNVLLTVAYLFLSAVG